MKITAPSLKLDMVLDHVTVKEGRPVIVCRLGVYEATTDLSREDVVALLKCMLRPRVFWAFINLVFRAEARTRK